MSTSAPQLRPGRCRALLVAALVTGAIGLAASAGTASTSTPADRAAAAPSAATPRLGAETITVRWPDSAGTSRTGAVTVSKTQNLSTREIVSISWKGFLPTQNADGPESTHQAPQSPARSGYPVVLMQCQGTDPAKMTPEDCPIPNPGRFYGYATKDALETPQVQAASPYDARPFRDTEGKLHTSPGTYQNVDMPSDYSDENVIGTNWYATWSESDGTRTNAKFEVRSTKEAPQSLGCGDPETRTKGGCSIVVVPIRPLQCVDDTSCLPPNSTSGLSGDYHQWQSASNWRNKFVFPLTYKPFPDVCDLDSRSSVPTQGSELIDEAMLSWVPKFCGSSDLFKLAFTRTNDAAARASLTTGLGNEFQSDLAFTSLPARSTEDRPLVNAPIALTGFTVALAIDDKDFEEVTAVDLNARLIAKLVTQSYYAPPVPHLEGNPSDLLHDPEFAKLNPQLMKRLDPSVQIDSPVLVQGNPDLVWEVTRYLASDPQAVAWLDGKADPWGMKVNKYFKGRQWPVPNESFDLRDPWKDPQATGEEKCDPKPVMEQQSQFVYNLLATAIALVDRQPQNFSVCKPSGQAGDIWTWAKPDRQALGRRSMIAITDLAHAARYQMPTAALQNAAGRFIEPDLASLRAAYEVARVDARSGVISADMDSRSAAAYPGFMAVYAAGPTHGLDRALAGNYAEMITWMATSGQAYGDAAGQLPQGYLALPDALRAQAKAAAKHIADQDSFGAVRPTTQPTTDPSPSPDPTTSNPTTSSPSGPSVSPTTPPSMPTASQPTQTAAGPPPSVGPTPDPEDGTPTVVPTSAEAFVAEPIATTSQTSPLAEHLFPVLMGLGIAGLVIVPALVFTTNPQAQDWKRRQVKAVRSKLNRPSR